MIKLKPLQQVNESDVINGFFTLNSNTGDEGNFVTVIGSGCVIGNNKDLYRFINLTSTPNVVSQRRVMTAQVKLSTSGEDKGDVLGVALKNVRSVDYLGRDLLYDDVRKTEANAVLSGESLPIAKRGMFLVSGIEGTPGIGSGIAVSNSNAGGWRSFNTAVETTVKSLGQFLGANDRDGYALVWLDV